jgi:hypothetical protein
MKALAALTALLISTSLADEPKHVRIWGPATAGSKQQLKIALAVKLEESTTLKGRDPQTDNREFAAKFEGIFTETRVNAKGMTTESHFKISKVEYLENGKEKPLLKEGDEVVARHAQPKTIIEVNGEAASEEQMSVLTAFLQTSSDDESTPSELYEADYPVLPGEKWEVNRNKLARSYQQHGYPVDSNSVKGTVVFVGPTKFDDQPACSFNIEYTASAKDYAPPGAPGNSVINASYEGKSSTLVSSGDPNAYGQTKFFSDIRMEFKSAVQQGGDKVDFQGTRRTKVALQAEWRAVK